MSAQEIFNRLRGFTPFPGCYTFFDGRRLEIIGARAEPVDVRLSQYSPGVVCDATKESFAVACGEGTMLRITEVQPEGKRAMSARDFLNGAQIGRGDRFG
jgi:methionyl-tRNA formyltransferase